jgi:hypothetical protein
MAKLTPVIFAERAEQATKDHQNTPDHDGNSATPSIGNEGTIRVSRVQTQDLQAKVNSHERKADQTTNLVDCVHQSQLGARRVMEILLPVIQILGGVKHHSMQDSVSSIHLNCSD